uniref:Uncharacterized protein n=1 Tax=Anopheles merus TaxID=30066 RepID=A0A182UZT0_ANOME
MFSIDPFTVMMRSKLKLLMSLIELTVIFVSVSCIILLRVAVDRDRLLDRPDIILPVHVNARPALLSNVPDRATLPADDRTDHLALHQHAQREVGLTTGATTARHPCAVLRSVALRPTRLFCSTLPYGFSNGSISSNLACCGIPLMTILAVVLQEEKGAVHTVEYSQQS